MRASISWCCWLRNSSCHILRLSEFHRFLTAFSVRPGSFLLMSDHLLPMDSCSASSRASSSSVHSVRVMVGSRWLVHLSRHCLPVRTCQASPLPPPSLAWMCRLTSRATSVHRDGPYSSTSPYRNSSSSGVQGPLAPGLMIVFQRLMHSASVRVGLENCLAMCFQLRPLLSRAYLSNDSSSSAVHGGPLSMTSMGGFGAGGGGEAIG
mmetsp:Transcript_21600/g.52931  ORF Transcript_21600/g.52931 Transcript_21600/m.52931 type:complete len:207 (+) Transcript_21600:1122-1742(+)